MKCPNCEYEFKNPKSVAAGRAGGKIGGKAKVAKGFSMSRQPTAAARARGWDKRRNKHGDVGAFDGGRA